MRLEDAPDFMTPAEAKEVLRIGVNAVYAGVRTGEIPAVRFGRSIRIPRRGLEKLLLAEAAGTEVDGEEAREEGPPLRMIDGRA